jgi:23S rRNA (cytidine1920-2'-O)/16S rRNA (cytidine1409-2'-O)-methyltransferase
VRRSRLDLELVRRGLAATVGQARDAVLAGRITVGGRPALKPATLVAAGEPLAVEAPPRPYVSRGGEKLAAALEAFGIDPAGSRCLDAGASTGGFTDVLLSRGAEHVTAVDVGYGQLAWRLRRDPRVTVIERKNVRDLGPSDLAAPPDLVVADLSFISLVKVLPGLSGVAADRAEFVLLVKPQFEAEPEEVERGGVVRDPGVWRRAIADSERACRRSGLGPLGVIPSPLAGPAGNVEFLLHAAAGQAGRDLDVGAAISKARDIWESGA